MSRMISIVNHTIYRHNNWTSFLVSSIHQVHHIHCPSDPKNISVITVHNKESEEHVTLTFESVTF